MCKVNRLLSAQSEVPRPRYRKNTVNIDNKTYTADATTLASLKHTELIHAEWGLECVCVCLFVCVCMCEGGSPA